MFRKLFSIILISLIALSLSACGSKEQTATKGQGISASFGLIHELFGEDEVTLPVVDMADAVLRVR